MRFGCYGVRSGHTESFIAGDRERPIGDIQAIEFFPVQPLQKERL